MKRLVLLFSVLFPMSILSACCKDAINNILNSIQNKNYTEMELLLKDRPNLSCKNYDGITVLGSAVRNRDVEAIRILLDAGADPNLVDGGVTPLYIAALMDCEKCATEIIAAGGKISADEVQIRNLKMYNHTSSDFWNKILGGISP